MKKYLPLLLSILVAVYVFSIAPITVASQAGKAYAEADDRLNKVYQQLVTKVTDARDRQRLRSAQQAWIKLRDADVSFYGQYYVNSKGGLFLKTKLTEDRTVYLKSMLTQPPQPDGDNTGPV
jgi:uncharacterized protein YecT (DUF1311 family)